MKPTRLERSVKELSPVYRKTKVVCSVGPSSESQQVLEQLIQKGVNVFRINCSFGTHEILHGYIENVRNASKAVGIPVSILGDLQGPKFRTGDFEAESIPLEKGQIIELAYTKEKGSASRITTPNAELVKALQPGVSVLINDGILEIKVVEKISDTLVKTEVVRGGKLSARKGLNVPQVAIPFTDLVPKDKLDAVFLLKEQVDYVGQSFVQTHTDVQILRQYLKDHATPEQSVPGIIAKIEKPTALDNIDAILAEADGIMVARGDLGVELSLELVPIAQKMLIAKAKKVNKPVITATQMLQSMMVETVPLRAEVSDVANAVFDCTDAVMTSGETTMSPHPSLVIEWMDRILRATELHLPTSSVQMNALNANDVTQEDLRMAVAASALLAAQKASVKAIMVFSASGEMAKIVSAGRPSVPVFVFTPSEHVAGLMRLFYGVYPIVMPFGKFTDTTIANAEEKALHSGFVSKGDLVVLCSGATSLPGLSNITKMYNVGQFLSVLVDKWRQTQ
mmetsp:Transcript_18842/g.26347  ORF Transcript_18842/g.26347 Transcript_18842/m.26347 type:complete len:509 (-) Transcript_18842:47-1573(-)